MGVHILRCGICQEPGNVPAIAAVVQGPLAVYDLSRRQPGLMPSHKNHFLIGYCLSGS